MLAAASWKAAWCADWWRPALANPPCCEWPDALPRGPARAVRDGRKRRAGGAALASTLVDGSQVQLLIEIQLEKIWRRWMPRNLPWSSSTPSTTYSDQLTSSAGLGRPGAECGHPHGWRARALLRILVGHVTKGKARWPGPGACWNIRELVLHFWRHDSSSAWACHQEPLGAIE